MKGVKGIILIAVIVVIGLLVVDAIEPSYGFFSKVPAGSVGILTTFGAVGDNVIDAGFHVKAPFAKVTAMNVRTQKGDAALTAFSSDIQQVDVSVSYNYSVDKSTAMNLFREVGVDYPSTVITPRLLENVKVVFARYNAERLIEQRESLSGEIMDMLQTDLTAYGITVSSVSIEDIDFTDAFTSAVEDKQVATQKKLAAETEQERLTMEATSEAERKVIQAQADAEVAKINADNEAYAITAKANAEAVANKQLTESLTKDLIDYIQANNWDGKLPTFVGADTILPIISESVISGD